ncbi:unnamed protein product [Eretmochelys imbricata]
MKSDSTNGRCSHSDFFTLFNLELLQYTSAGEQSPPLVHSPIPAMVEECYEGLTFPRRFKATPQPARCYAVPDFLPDSQSQEVAAGSETENMARLDSCTVCFIKT